MEASPSLALEMFSAVVSSVMSQPAVSTSSSTAEVAGEARTPGSSASVWSRTAAPATSRPE